MSDKLKIVLSSHQHKGRNLWTALEAEGHTVMDVSTATEPADILLIDVDIPEGRYLPTIEAWTAAGAKTVIYQHGAEPILIWDGIYKPSDRTVLNLVQSPGAKRVLEAYGYPIPVEVVGWHYCPLRDFRPSADIQRVTFAPWHPLGNGYLHPARAAYNQRVHDMLYAASVRMGFELTVRHIRPLSFNGIYPIDGVHYINARPDGNTEQITSADLVVAVGTYAYMSVALGTPTVMFGQDLRPFDGHDLSKHREVANWHLYRDIMRYPYDFDDVSPLDNLLLRAATYEATDWRKMFIGEPLDAKRMVQLLQGILT